MKSPAAALTRSLPRLVAASVAAVAVLAVGPTAGAETWNHRDPAHDMYQDEVGLAPQEAQGDITRVRMDHRASGLVVRVNVRELHKEHFSFLDVFLEVPAHDGKPAKELYTEYYFSLAGGNDVGISDSRTGFLVKCRPVKGTKSYRHDWLQLVVPRGCFGKSGTVRVGVYFREARRTMTTSFSGTDYGTRKGVGAGRKLSPALSVG